MFKKRARNFRARKAESSSSEGGGSADEEPGPVAPPGSEEQHGQRQGNSRPRAARGLACSSRVHAEDARAVGGLLKADSPPVTGEESTPVAPAEPEQRSSLLSFEGQAEGDEEQFQIKKPNYSEVLFKVQRKGIQSSPDRHNQGSQGNQESLSNQDAENIHPKDVHEVEDVGESSGSEDSQSSSSSSQSSSSQSNSSQSNSSESSSSQKKHSIPQGAIPDAQRIVAARQKRLLAREQGDYIALDASPRNAKRNSDTYGDDEIDDHEKRIAFAPKPKTLRQRIAEKLEPHSSEGSDDSEENEIQDKWEEQQFRKAVKVPQRNDADDSSPRRSRLLKRTFKPPLPRPVVNLEDMKRQLSARLTSFEEIHRSHKQEYDKMVHDVESSKNNIEKIETASNAALQHTFYQSMKIYADNLADCLNEKMSRINDLESSLHLLQHGKAKALLQRRQEDLHNESAAIQRSGKPVTSATHIKDDEVLQNILEECMSRRAARKEARETLGNSDHHNGMSSDDDLPPAQLVNLQQERDKILKESKKVFEDVHKDFCGIRNILTKFRQWRETFPESYYDAYISLCLPKLLNPLLRIQLIAWNPLEGSLELEQMPWFRSIKDFCLAKRETESMDDENCDDEILPKIIEKTIIPKISDFVEHVWDPLSSTQTNNLVELCKIVLIDYGPNKGKQELLILVVSRLRQSIDDDVYIPLYSKSDLEDNSSPHAVFQERQFWTAVKLLHNVLQWDGLVEEQVLQELALNKLLNRYLLLVLLNAQPCPQSLEKCTKIVSCLPDVWFKDLKSGATLPQLTNLSKHLLQFGHAMHKNNYREETGEVVLLLIRIKAVDFAEVLIEQYGLHHLKNPTEK